MKISLHDRALNWVSELVNGEINHFPIKPDKDRITTYSKRHIKPDGTKYSSCSICGKQFSSVTKAQVCHLDEKNELLKKPKKRRTKIGKSIPDVVAHRKDRMSRRITDFHEVEVVHFPENRLDAWSLKGNKSFSLIDKNADRVLWLTFPKGFSKSFDRIRLIEQTRDAFSVIHSFDIDKPMVGRPPK